MKGIVRIFALALGAGVFTAAAQGHLWTDITPANWSVQAVGTHVLDGNRLIIQGFRTGGSTGPSPVMYSNDAGRSWNAPFTSLPSNVDSMFVDVARPGVVYLERAASVSAGILGLGRPVGPGHLYRSEDFGRTWLAIYTIAVGDSVLPVSPDPLDARGIYAFRQEVYVDYRCPGFCVETRNPGVTRTDDGGVSWSSPVVALSGNDVNAVFLEGPTPSAPTRMFISTFDKGTFASVDRGATWSRIDSGLPSPLRWIRADPQRANVLYGYRPTSEGSRLLRSDDGGVTWGQIFGLLSYSEPLFPSTFTIDPARPNVIWMSYYGAEVIYRTENRGGSWQAVPFPLRSMPPGYFPGGTVVVSLAEPGVVYFVWFNRLYRGVAVAPDPVVVEFEYEGNRYWPTSLGGEAVSQDYRQEPGHAHRTGNRFGAWRVDDAPKGAVGSCRFWPRPETGLRTRVLVLQGFECDWLRNDPGWILEAENEFYAIAPVNETCPVGTVAVRRFNNLSADVNHRLVSDAGTADVMLARGWYDEGLRFCGRFVGANE